jgi:protein-S-isoprenylcysteine O-methyltransferase Ste14
VPRSWNPRIELPLFVRTITYAALFVGLVLIYIPARLLSWTGIPGPPKSELQQIAGSILGTFGGTISLWCILVFASTGRGTPAPFDPPRKLVVEGPYRYVRNPMYIGAVLALAGAALFWGAWSLLVYAMIFLLAAHFFVVVYEEPALHRSFGRKYEDYCRRVGRWWPHLDRHHDPGKA